MRKIIPIIFLTTILLSSCNFPIGQKPTLDANQISTRVAQTLAVLQPEVTQTTQPLPTQSSAVATATSTPEIIETATPTSTATSTTQPGDPRLSLGEPEFYDNFTSGSAFGLSSVPIDDDDVITKVENGVMVFQGQNNRWGRRWRLAPFDPKNMYLEGTFKTLACSGKDQYGLNFRAPNYEDGVGYYFGVSCDGMYNFFWYDKNTFHKIIEWTADSNIQSGIGQLNRLGVMAVNDTFKFYINGVMVKEIIDNNISNKGHIGVFVSAFEHKNFTVHVEEISVWPLP